MAGLLQRLQGDPGNMQPSHQDGPLKARLARGSIQVHHGGVRPYGSMDQARQKIRQKDITIALTITGS